MPGLLGMEKAEQGEPVEYSVDEMAEYLAGDEFSGSGSDLLAKLEEHGFSLVKSGGSAEDTGEGGDKPLKSGKPKISIAIMRESAVNSAMGNSDKEEY